MEIVHEAKGQKGQFVAAENGELWGVMTYTHAGDDRIIIDHTETLAGHEGKGVGKKLVEAGVNFARTHNWKILPLCPFAKALFDKTPAFEDVLF